MSRFRDRSLNEDYDVQLRLTARERNDADVIARLYVPSQTGGLIRLDNLVKLESVPSASRIDRLDRQRMVSLRASIGPGYALADRLAALREAATTLNLPAAYTTTISGRGRELERTFSEVHVGVSVVDYLHVHDSRFSVRKPGPSADDSALFPALYSVCTIVALADGEHPESLFGLRSARVIWRGEEERYSPN